MGKKPNPKMKQVSKIPSKQMVVKPNPKMKQVSKIPNKQMSETDSLQKASLARAVEKVVDDLLDDPEAEIQMMDVQEPMQAQPELDTAILLMLADVALTHADLKPYER